MIVHSGSRSKRVIYKRETEDLQVSDEDELDQQQPAPSHDLEVPQPTHHQPVRIQFEDLSGSESSNEGGFNSEGPNPANGGRRSGGTSTHARSYTNNRFRTEEGEESSESDQAEGFAAEPGSLNGAHHMLLSVEDIRDLESDGQNGEDTTCTYVVTSD